MKKILPIFLITYIIIIILHFIFNFFPNDIFYVLVLFLVYILLKLIGINLKLFLNKTITEKDNKKLKVWHLVLIVVLFSWGATLSESDDVGKTCSDCRTYVNQMGLDPASAASVHKKICK